MQLKNKVIKGHVLDILKELPDNSVDIIITGAPFWSLVHTKPENIQEEKFIFTSDENHNHDWIDYECKGCDGYLGFIGFEPTPDRYIKNLLIIFDELYRVLKETGLLWYQTSYDTKEGNNELIPERLKIGMVEKGWKIIGNVILHDKTMIFKTRFKRQPVINYNTMIVAAKSDKYYWKNRKSKGVWSYDLTNKYRGYSYYIFSEQIVSKILDMSCPPKGFVLDPFVGSGQVVVSASQAGMDYLGIDIDEKAIEICKTRLNTNPVETEDLMI